MAFEKSKRLLCVKVNQKCVVIRVEQSWRKMIWINRLPNPDFLRVKYIDLNTLEHWAASWDRHLHKENFNSFLVKQKKNKIKIKKMTTPSFNGVGWSSLSQPASSLESSPFWVSHSDAGALFSVRRSSFLFTNSSRFTRDSREAISDYKDIKLMQIQKKTKVHKSTGAALWQMT